MIIKVVVIKKNERSNKKRKNLTPPLFIDRIVRGKE